MKLVKLSQNRNSMWDGVPLFGSDILEVRRGEHWQRIRDKMRCYWEQLWGTYRQPREHHEEPIEI